MEVKEHGETGEGVNPAVGGMPTIVRNGSINDMGSTPPRRRESKMNTNVCPTCGGTMTPRMGPNGRFVVCGNCLTNRQMTPQEWYEVCLTTLVGMMYANRGVFTRLKNC